MSEEGAQQGDPLSPLDFCLVIKELLESVMSELVLAYLADISLGDEAEVCLHDFLRLDEGTRIGLEINHNKCEVVGHTVESRALFEAHNILLPESSFSKVILLGAPLSLGQHVDSVLEEKLHELQLLTKRLAHMPAHDSLYLLRNVLTAPRLMYILRTTSCTNSLILPLYDAVIRDSLSVSLNVELDEMAPGVAAGQVGRPGRPWCWFAGTVRLFGFSRKHLGA
jgi:hypothetical protein